ncbi:hypothetical protein BDY21DRAFT_79753 [Lineolata rhizophorae]|uniref:Uncharacterized protein n=1 Tax=Lineolata rhizophorae TaxID=578093 RepID=A0A6A6NUH0_9PEZI|nr:hypothetical protein BDY21DRAFT_79753 [Lineolata rhizophorae]
MISPRQKGKTLTNDGRHQSKKPRPLDPIKRSCSSSLQSFIILVFSSFIAYIPTLLPFIILLICIVFFRFLIPVTLLNTITGVGFFLIQVIQSASFLPVLLHICVQRTPCLKICSPTGRVLERGW